MHTQQEKTTHAHPIPYTAPMVRAIIAGQKTQTRRLNGFSEINKNPDEWHLYGLKQNPELIVGADKYGNDKVKKMSGYYALFEHTELGECYRSVKCPYGRPGDHLLVRETHLQWQYRDGEKGEIVYYDDPNIHDILRDKKSLEKQKQIGNWRIIPSIHMPRAASRTLWKSINGPHSWDANPWVWAITFKKI